MQSHLTPTGVVVADRLGCKLAPRCHSRARNTPERPPASVAWPLGLSDGFDVVAIFMTLLLR